jgi:hypothetical protein
MAVYGDGLGDSQGRRAAWRPAWARHHCPLTAALPARSPAHGRRCQGGGGRGVIPATARPRAQGRDRHVRLYQQRAGPLSHTVVPRGSGSAENPGDTATTDHQDEGSDDA